MGERVYYTANVWGLDAEKEPLVLPAMYGQWYGQPVSALSALTVLNEIMEGRGNDLSYAFARLVQVFTNHCDGNLSLGMYTITPDQFDDQEWGTYELFWNSETRRYDFIHHYDGETLKGETEIRKRFADLLEQLEDYIMVYRINNAAAQPGLKAAPDLTRWTPALGEVFQLLTTDQIRTLLQSGDKDTRLLAVNIMAEHGLTPATL